MWWGDEEVTARIYGRVSLKISCLPTAPECDLFPYFEVGLSIS